MSGHESENPDVATDESQTESNNKSQRTEPSNQLVGDSDNALGIAAAVKERRHRERSEQSKLNRINELQKEICQTVNFKLKQYETIFENTAKGDIDALESHLEALANDKDVLVLYDELNVLLNNKIDENIQTMYNDFEEERQSNIQLITVQLEELHKQEQEAQEIAATEMAQEIERQMAELQQRKARQQEVRRAFEQKPSIRRPPTLRLDETTTQETRSQEPVLITEPFESSETRQRTISIVQATTTPKMEPELCTISKLAESITTSMKMTKRSTIEPSIFCGEILEFTDWETDFDDFLETEGIEGVRKLRMLKKYVGGEAKKCIGGFLMNNTIEAYIDARDHLQNRYGKKLNIARQFKIRLKEWPRITPRDSKGLQEFADFLAHCKSAMKTVPLLNSLDEPDQNLAMVEKLPEWIQIKWRYRISDYEDLHDNFPDFKTFASFIMKEAKVSNVLPSQAFSTRLPEGKRNDRQESKPKRTTSLNTSSEKTEKQACMRCGKSNHTTDTCLDLVKMSYDSTIEWVNSKRLCYRCIKENHQASACPERATCRKCRKPHPTILHKTKEDWDNYNRQNDKQDSARLSNAERCSTSQDEKPQGAESSKVNVKNTKSKEHILSMVLPVYISTDNSTKEVLTYAMLDSQSDACFVSHEIASKISPAYETEQLTVMTMIGSKEEPRKLYRDLHIRGYFNKDTTTISAYETKDIPCEKHQIPSNAITNNLTYLNKIREQLPPPLDITVGLLLGTNCSEALAPIDHINGAKGEPFAIKTLLGWTVCGRIGNETHLRSLKTDTKKDEQILQLLETDFKDCDGTKTSQEDIKFMRILREHTSRSPSGNYVLPLPLKERAILPLNRAQAEKRLTTLIKKLKTDKQYGEEYHKFMNNLLKKGHAEEVLPAHDPKPGAVWYIPHFAVTHPKKKKLRVVFDASAKHNGISLNDVLFQGPDLMNSLVGILLRFRREKVAMCCDIESMFYNFQVPESQRDYLRFLWIESDTEKVKEYRMTVHLFGATSSPAVATFGLRRLAADYQLSSQKAAEFLCEDFYVDDGITSVSTSQIAIELFKNTTVMCSQGNIRLHKFISNNRQVMNYIPPSERSESTTSIDLNNASLPEERALGIQWNVESDCFQYKLNIETKPTTKRGILSTVAQVYDPLGFAGPFILKGKQILQKVTSAKLPWDAPVPQEEEIAWKEWLEELEQLQEFKVERWVQEADMEIINRQIHVFSDASLKGYGACCYLRLVGADKKVHTTLLFAKSRVAPIKPVTVPRLELQAAVIAVRICKTVVTELKMNIDETHFWCDSKVVLGYIANEAKRFHMFVANRVHEIHQNSSPDQWHHVPTNDNPADIASRGAAVKDLIHSSWKSGPNFLKQVNIDRYTQVDTSVPTTDNEDPEVRKLRVLATSTASSNNLIERFSKYSNLSGLLKSMAILKQAAKNKKWTTAPITVEAIQEAETFVIKMTQAATYHREIQSLKNSGSMPKSSSIAKLNPYLDKNEILRVGGRLQRSEMALKEKCPVIIPKHSHLTRLIVRYYHHKIHHLGRRSSLAAIREAGYWIINGTSSVKSEIRQCIICARLRKPLEQQIMGNLPTERLQKTPPFTHVGMDVFGPYLVKDRRSTVKRYGLIFTCLYSRATHIEMLDDLSTDSFINALRCLTAMRGQISTLYSDNATNFVGAKNVFDKELDIVTNGRLRQYLLENRTEFKTITPHASHQGGSWERVIRSARAVLNGMAMKYKERLNTQTLRTAFYEVSNILNNKPLAATDVGSPEEEIVTPNQLLTMKTNATPPPPPGEFTNTEVYGRTQWKKAQQLADEFHKAWKSEYLTQISQRQKWTKTQRNLEIGDIVILKDEGTSRNFWSLAAVQDTHKGEDGRVRNVTLRLANRNLTNKGKPLSPSPTLKRPVQQVVLLLSP